MLIVDDKYYTATSLFTSDVDGDGMRVHLIAH